MPFVALSFNPGEATLETIFLVMTADATEELSSMSELAMRAGEMLRGASHIR